MGKRIERIVEAEKVFNEAFYSSSFGICDYKTMRANLRKRFQGKPVKRIPIEEAIDKIAAKSQFYEQYRLTRNGGSPDSFFVQVMGEFYMLLARYAYNFDEDDTLPRLEKGRRALNGLVHESAFYRQKGGAPHRVYENIMLEYPEYAKRARELFKRGFPPMHPSDICFVDEKTGVMQFV